MKSAKKSDRYKYKTHVWESGLYNSCLPLPDGRFTSPLKEGRQAPSPELRWFVPLLPVWANLRLFLGFVSLWAASAMQRIAKPIQTAYQSTSALCGCKGIGSLVIRGYGILRAACAMLRIVKPVYILPGFLFLMCGILTFSCTSNSSSPENNPSQHTGPEITLDLQPGDNNPRNSEGDFINLKDGRIMFVYSKYVGESSSDHAPASLAARYSSDGGMTWTHEDEVIVPNEGGMNVMSVTLLRLQNGDIALFYLRKNSTEDCIPMLRISRDEAQTWSEAISCITDKEGYFVLNNARVIQLEDGRLMMAVARHNQPGGEWKSQADLFAYYSDDNGQTWTSSAKVPNETDIVTQEPGLIEMNDGRIMMYIRANGGFQQLSYSSDRGQTWSPIETSNIPSPLSPATIEKVPGTDDWLLVWNNNDGSDPALKGKRTPITAAISPDEGKTWNYVKNIEDDSDGWYCYIAIHFVDDNNVLLGYCAGNRPAGTGLSVTHVTHIPTDWLYQESL